MADVYADLVNGATMGAFLKMARAMGEEDGHPLDADGEAAVRALATGDPFARAWLFRAEPDGPIVGYVVLTFGFSIEYGGRDCFIDELYVEPDARAGAGDWHGGTGICHRGSPQAWDQGAASGGRARQ